MNRIRTIARNLAANNVDALIITNMSNVFYVSGFTGSAAMVVITERDASILVDSRYTLQAKRQCEDLDVVEFSAMSVFEAATKILERSDPKRVGVEADYMTMSDYGKLVKFAEGKYQICSTSGIVERLRCVKDAKEIEAIRAAIRISDTVFRAMRYEIKPGVTEKHMAAFIDNAMRELGADGTAFSTISASGPNTALPHAYPTDRPIQAGEFYLADYGARLNMYNSDITRTFFVGEPNAKQYEIYDTVLTAQKAAIKAIRPGKTGAEIDKVARDIIAYAGFGDCFGHSLGHSLGIDTHDGAGFSPKSSLVLKPGMVITVEPGIYIEGFGGVRIEDDILVTENGCEVLTDCDKERIIL